MTEQHDGVGTPQWLDRRLVAERERARRLRAATSALAAAAVALVVSLSLPWAVSADEDTLDPARVLQLDEPGLWRADGWFLLRDAVLSGTAGGGAGGPGGTWTALLTVVPLLGAAVAAWALVRQDGPAASVARIGGGVALVVLLVLGLRVLDGAGVDLGSGFWLAVAASAVVAAGGHAIDRAVRAPA